MAQYPGSNENEWSLLKKIAENTALISDDEAGDVSSVNGRTGAVVLTKADVGLTNVTDNPQAIAGLATASLITTPTATIIGRSTAGTGALESLTAAQTKTLLSLNNVENTALSTWAGSTAITTLGTIATGSWNGTLIAGQYGGTGVANTGKTVTLGGNLTTSGAFALILTLSGSTNVTLPTSGTLLTSAGAVTSLSGTANQITASAATGAVTLSLPATITGPTSITIGNQVLNANGIYSGGGSPGQGRLYYSATNGQVLQGQTGSSNDICLAAANGTVIIVNPTGTGNITFPAGSITTAAPTVGAAAAWNLGTYSADLVTVQTGVLRVNVAGVSYKIICST